MSERPPIDPERIAALIDGRLSADARAALLEELSDSPEGLEILSHAAQLVEEATDLPSRPRAVAAPRAWRRQAMWFATAAAVIVVSVGVVQRFRHASELPGPEVVVAMLQPATSGADVGLLADPWPQTRGGGAVGSQRATAVRIGAMLTDLEVRSRTPVDSTDSRLLAKIAALLGTVPGGSVAARAFQSDSVIENAALRHDAMLRAERVAGPTFVRAGVWLEAARIAIAQHDSTFFAKAAPDGLRTLKTAASEMPSSEANLDQISRVLTAQTIDWDLASSEVSRLLLEWGR